jgi:hypothetical protein
MSTAGYSGTPLSKKLGLKAGSRLRTENAPPDFLTWLEPLPADVQVATEADRADVAVLFVLWREDLLPLVESALPLLADRGGLWIAWPKRASKVPTDVTEDTLRDYLLPLGIVDNKVCAINETWSGLRFVRRLKQ